MDRPQEILPGKGIEAQAGTAEEIREERIQHASMAMFEDYSEPVSYTHLTLPTILLV